MWNEQCLERRTMNINNNTAWGTVMMCMGHRGRVVGGGAFVRAENNCGVCAAILCKKCVRECVVLPCDCNCVQFRPHFSTAVCSLQFADQPRPLRAAGQRQGLAAREKAHSEGTQTEGATFFSSCAVVAQRKCSPCSVVFFQRRSGGCHVVSPAVPFAPRETVSLQC